MAKPTVAAGFPKAFLDFAASRGADRRVLIERSGIEPNDLDKQDNRVPLENYVALLKAGIELCKEPALALLFGEAVSLPDISIVGLLGMSFENIETGRRQMNRYVPLMLDEDIGDDSDRIEFINEADKIWLKFTSRIYVENPLITESGLARAACGARAMLKAKGISADNFFLKEIHFTLKEPDYRAEYDRIFGVPLVFGSHTNAFLLNEDFLSFSLPPTNPYLASILTAHAEELLQNLERSKSFRGRVESLLIPLLHTRETSIETDAGQLGVSRQTLFRRLKAEGTNFEKVLDELRHKLALHYLNEKKTSISETAYLLGFSEPAAFSRAFKRWTGSSPRSIQIATNNGNRSGS